MEWPYSRVNDRNTRTFLGWAGYVRQGTRKESVSKEFLEKIPTEFFLPLDVVWFQITISSLSVLDPFTNIKGSMGNYCPELIAQKLLSNPNAAVGPIRPAILYQNRSRQHQLENGILCFDLSGL